jgi:hypothetical protein
MNYTCTDYRTEMILLGLKRRLELEDLSTEEKKEILKQIKKLEAAMGLD